MPGTGENEQMNTAGAAPRPRLPRPRSWSPLLAASLALGVLAVLQAILQQPADGGSAGGGSAGGAAGAGLPLFVLVLLVLATTVPLGLLGPRAGALVIAAASVASLGPTHTYTLAGLACLLIAVGRLAYRGAPLVAGLVAMAFVVLALVGNDGLGPGPVLILVAAGVPAAAWAGSARRARRESVARSAEREAMAGSLIEHTARGERARISRELHDVVAHHISMIAVQAETARLATPGMPEAGAQRLAAIGDTARSALTEMRRLLGVLRADTRSEDSGGEASGSAVPERRPQPGLAQLNQLLDEARDASGAVTRLIVSGRVTVLDPGVELAAYRIIQEALTNARRHAPGAAVDVELRYEGSDLYLRVRDNGPGPPATPAQSSGDRLAGTRHAGSKPAGGHGLLGMRERAAGAGGTLRTGLAAGGGFVVEARLPAATQQDAA